MKKRLYNLILLTTLNFLIAQSNTINIPADFSSIQQGINHAFNGDTVLVAPGNYYENINFKGKNIVLTSYLILSQDTSFIKSTIINGSQSKNSDTASCVLFINNESNAAVLQGFTITGGKGTKWKDEHSSGTYREGGGILAALSSPTIINNIIINNEAINTSGVTSAGGGGIRAGDGNPVIVDNVIMNNQGRYGAGVVLNWTGAYVANNIITGNSGGQDYGGGALWMNHDGPASKIIENNTIANNKTVAVYSYQGTSIIRNCIIWADENISATQISSRVDIPTVSYSDVYGGYSGEGNIFVNPKFLTISYLLSDSSPCIDKGNGSAIYNDPEDIQNIGNARFPSKGKILNDMGAYGGPYSRLISTFATPSIAKVPTATYQKTMFENTLQFDCFPNPATNKITLKYSLSVKQNIKLSIIDLSGREIYKLVDKQQNTGIYSFDFPTNIMERGIYIIKIAAGSDNRIQKLVLK
jgi:Secretion system C-terminal sorting domain